MENFYKVLGINSSATPEEVRRAYRILARRYHPDLNPGDASAERFKLISQAYETLSDPEKRRNYDIEFEGASSFRGGAAERAYRRAARAAAQAENRRRYQEFQAAQAARAASAERSTNARTKSQPRKTSPGLLEKAGAAIRGLGLGLTRKHQSSPTRSSRLSVVEVSVTLRDAVLGVKKAIEIPEPSGARKISIKIPPGSRNGTVVHLRATQDPPEELVLIVRVASHPFLSLQAKGLVIDTPITVNEAICGASISVPTLDEPISIKVPPGSQSGTELRVRGRGIPQKDGTKGDLFYRLLIKVPEATSAAGLVDKAKELELYYGGTVRRPLLQGLLD